MSSSSLKMTKTSKNSSSPSSSKNTKTKKRRSITFDFNKNKTALYTKYLSDQPSPPIRGVPCSQEGIFPCIFRGVKFDSKEEWDDYMHILLEKQSMSGNKKLYKKKILDDLAKIGKKAKKIPPEYRLYNVQTGEIHDLRNMVSWKSL